MSLKYLLSLFRSIFNPITSGSNRLVFYDAALQALGTDASPNDIAPDDVACMETVDTIYRGALGRWIAGNQVTLSTYAGYRAMLASKWFTEVTQPLEGDILVYPTGTGNGNLPNGHIFIVNQIDNNVYVNSLLMSNDSPTGLFKQNYTIKTAMDRYETLGGFKPHFFRVN